MNKKIIKMYHGHLSLPRQSLLLSQELGLDLFGFYLCLIQLARWHRGNDNIGMVLGSQTEIAKKLHITQATFSRRLKELEKHRYFVIKRRGYILLGFFSLFLYDVTLKIQRNNYTSMNELYTDMHKINAELQINYANMQETRAQNSTQRLNSSYIDVNDLFKTHTEQE